MVGDDRYKLITYQKRYGVGNSTYNNETRVSKLPATLTKDEFPGIDYSSLI